MTSYIRVVDYIVLSTLHALLMSSLDDLLCMFKNVPLGYKVPLTLTPTLTLTLTLTLTVTLTLTTRPPNPNPNPHPHPNPNPTPYPNQEPKTAEEEAEEEENNLLSKNKVKKDTPLFQVEVYFQVRLEDGPQP